MRVRTLKPHFNHLGAAFEKKAGDEYDAGDHGEALIAGGLAEKIEGDEPPLDFGGVTATDGAAE
jgi:hypothetical protein